MFVSFTRHDRGSALLACGFFTLALVIAYLEPPRGPKAPANRFAA